MPERSPGPRRPLPSLLTPAQRRMLFAALVGAGFMVANTLYLVGVRVTGAARPPADEAPFALPALLQWMILSHTGMGLLVALGMIGFLVWHLPGVWVRRHRASIVSGVAFTVAGAVLVVTGLFILTDAASRANRWAWWAHVAAAALLPAGYVAHRVVSYTRPPRRRFTAFAGAALAGVLMLGALHGLTAGDPPLREGARAALAAGGSASPGGPERDVAASHGGPWVPPGWVPPASPFFPSPATTRSGGTVPSTVITGGAAATVGDPAAEAERDGFAAAVRVGAEACVRCHRDITEQWAASAHRFSSFNNPFYEATVRTLREARGTPNPWVRQHALAMGLEPEAAGRIKSQWCAGCHDPALLFSGRMAGDVDRSSLEAQAGLTCQACHQIDGIHDRTGNGNYDLDDATVDPYLFGSAGPGSALAFLHDATVRARPEAHRRQFLKPFFRTAEFCATCHKVSLSPPLNEYRWLRGQDEYDNWHDSGISRNASRTFYLPEQARVCQDCHMPPEPAPLGDLAADGGRVRSHRFLAVNTALPWLRGDTASLRRIEAFLRNRRLRVEIFAARVGRGRVDALMDLAGRDTLRLPPGQPLTLDVVVRNQGVGHTFPGGTNDSNEGWIEFTLEDESGAVLARSGAIGPDGFVDPDAHVYRAVILDADGRPIHDRDATRLRVTAMANVIGPGTADVAHYELTIPPALAGRRLVARARLLWRKFDRAYTGFAH
ncbi:MAG: hypothetical protein D6701_06265, partial [Gemmatimonadetes bacterium]